MIEYLKVQNLALLTSVTLDFESGFTVVSGETGAGKSILLGALRMLAGARVDKSIIQHGAEDCEVEAVVHWADPEQINRQLARLEMPLCEDGVLILKRRISAQRSARIQVNGETTTLAKLAEIGPYWIDFHGPEDSRHLFSDRWQLAVLDDFGKQKEAVRAYREQYRQWRQMCGEIEALRKAEQLGPDEIDFLQSQVRAIAL